jgi:hypothetical protein
MARLGFCLLLAWFAIASSAMAQTASDSAASPPFEVVKQDIDLEVAPDGRSWQISESRLRPLTAMGVKALQQTTLSYTASYQGLVLKGYTLKKDGRKIDIPQGDIMLGHGETSSPGFEDTRTMTMVFPNLEIGDQVVLINRSWQIVPWFPDVTSSIISFPRLVAVEDAKVAITTQGSDSAFRIVARGVEEDPPLTLNGKTRRTFRFHNDTPVKLEPGAVSEIDDGPQVQITSLTDYAQVAKLYADIFRDKAQVTPEISALASSLTVGARDRRAQAKALYEWVALHIQYVNIVLGAGGFQPHKAADVLKNGYGDCKDHVMLLQALLSARGIKSSAVLIRAGANQFRLPAAPSPFLFDHLISYVPEFSLYLDSTAHYAPFGILPGEDAGKSVIIVDSGKVAVTPADTAVASSVTAETMMTFNPDGSADGNISIHTTGTDAIGARAFMASLPLDGDTEFFRAALGTGSDGKFARGKPEQLDGDYDYSAHYHAGHAASFPGPGAIPAMPGYKPFTFSALIGDLPPTREKDYVCASGRYENTITLKFPPGTVVSALPPAKTFTAQGVTLRTDYQQLEPDTVRAQVRMQLDRPGPVCRAADYAALRPELSSMIGALLAQILYR